MEIKLRFISWNFNSGNDTGKRQLTICQPDETIKSTKGVRNLKPAKNITLKGKGFFLSHRKLQVNTTMWNIGSSVWTELCWKKGILFISLIDLFASCLRHSPLVLLFCLRFLPACSVQANSSSTVTEKRVHYSQGLRVWVISVRGYKQLVKRKFWPSLYNNQFLTYFIVSSKATRSTLVGFLIGGR